MGALADRCPECGKFVPKGELECASCGWVAEHGAVPASDPAREPQAGAGSRSAGVAPWNRGPWGVGRVLAGAAVGATLAVIALTAGAGDVGPVSAPPEPSAPTGSTIVDEPMPGDPPQPQTAAIEPRPSTPSARGRLDGPSALDQVPSPATWAELRRVIATIRAELSTWPERYQIGHSDLSNIRSGLDELERLIEKIPRPVE